jgi:hypothetical protein
LAKLAVRKLNRKKPDSRIAARSFICSRDAYVSHGCQARLPFAVKRARSGELQRRDGFAQDGSAWFFSGLGKARALQSPSWVIEQQGGAYGKGVEYDYSDGPQRAAFGREAANRR